MGTIRLKRVYDAAGPGDGERFLVERLWPRGIRKERAGVAGWLRDLAPSAALRTWYGHDPGRWPAFQKRYRRELQDPAKQASLEAVTARARRGAVTFVFAARDRERNSAVVLKRVIERRLRGSGAGKGSGRGEA